MDIPILAVLSVSALLQFLAAFFAFRLFKTTGRTPGWFLISLALFIMGVRRTVILWRVVHSSGEFIPDPVSEIFGLVISILLFLGVLWIAVFFHEKVRTETTLKETDLFLERAQEVARLGSYRLDIATGTWVCSKTLLDIFGIDESYRKDIKGWIKLVHPDQRQEMSDYLLKEVVGQKKPFNYDYRIVRADDGRLRWVHGMGIVDLDPEGKAEAMVGTIQDITERMVGDLEMRESERRFRTIVDNVNDGYIIHDFQGIILDCNENQCRMLGYRKEELVGRSLATIDGQQERDRFAERTRVLRETGSVEFDGIHLRKDKGEVPVMVSARLISRDGKGIVQSFIRDITERKNAETALRQSEQRFRVMAESLPQAVFETDKSGNLIYVNRSAYAMFGYTVADMEKGIHTLETVVPGDRPRALESTKAIMSGLPQTRGHEYMGVRKDGSTFPIVIYSNPKREGDSVTGLLGIIVDLTEVRKVEADRRQLQEQFFQAQKMESIGTLAGGIAHDFNNLLSGILGSLSLMEIDAGDKPELLREVTAMKGLVQRGSGLTRQLLGFARRGKYEAKPLDFTDVVRRTSELFSRTRKDVVVRMERAMEPVNVLGDRSQIEQVLMNLFVNAGQAMPVGGILYLQVERVELGPGETEKAGLKPGGYALVTVKDTGEGMEKAVLDRLFEPFFTTKGPGKGTGLGLASAYGIVKNHGGFIAVDSVVGQGSVFKVYLPETDVKPIQDPAPDGILFNGNDRPRRTILLVDDEESILRTCKRLLESIGFMVLLAKNGLEALELFKDRKDDIAVVVLDMVMPGLSGTETYESMKKLDPEVKVLFASGYIRESQTDMVLEKGKRGFIEKPFDLDALSAKLKELI